VPLRIHGLLDDASRFVSALAPRSSERYMLELFVAAMREHGVRKILFRAESATCRDRLVDRRCGLERARAHRRSTYGVPL